MKIYIKEELIMNSASEEAIPSDSGHDEDPATAGCDDDVNGSQIYIWSRPQHPWNSMLSILSLEVPVD
jgi:hypothetical protein